MKDSPFVITLRVVSWEDPSLAKCQLLVSYGNNLQAVQQDILTSLISRTELDQMVRGFGESLLGAFLQKTNGKTMLARLTSSGGADSSS